MGEIFFEKHIIVVIEMHNDSIHINIYPGGLILVIFSNFG